ncbi:MAG: glycerate kinase [Christensenellaceae bacterium]|jgi:glycerate kinase|nr:glycerate kinase [Christensenellaceae bacterium]
MKKFLLVPDSFKGTMSSAAICAVMRSAILHHFPAAEVVSIPVADGGEGSVDAFLSALGGQKINVRAQGPLGEEIDSFYGVLPDHTAVIEMAACAGLPLVYGRMQPSKTTTYGVGQLMRHALASGCRKIIVGLGGSATNDLGSGAAAALGVRFLDAQGQVFLPTGGTLGRIASIDMSALESALLGAEITTMCDIDNPLYGERGAAYVFGPQKGADADMVRFLDAQLRAAAEVIRTQLGRDIAELPGAGAAGGMGGGMVAFLGSRLQPGIETVLDTVRFDALLRGADLVLTGEGRLDSQTLGGKVVAGVARRAKKQRVPVLAIVGEIGDNIGAIYEQGVSAIFSINRAPVDFSISKHHSAENLAIALDNLMRFLRALPEKEE